MITFIHEPNCIFAIEQNVERNGKFYDELMYCEIVEQKHGNEVRLKLVWEDDWHNPVYFRRNDSKKGEMLKDVQQYVINNYFKHTPYINGGEYDLK